jgi:hypothetical protein
MTGAFEPCQTMKQSIQNTSDLRSDDLFFLAVLIVLIGCTLFSGGTAIILASGVLNEATVDVAQIP